MRRFLPYLSLSYSFFITISAQQGDATILPCALECLDQRSLFSTCGRDDQICLCADPAFQVALTSCVFANCTMNERFVTHDITANICAWPYHDETSELRDISLSLLAIATVFVGVRIVVRLPGFRGPMGYDDYLMLIIWMFLVAYASLIWLANDSGLGTSIWDVPPDSVTTTLRYFAFLEWIYYIVIWLTKISILLLYLRLFPSAEFRRLIKIGLIICSISGIMFLFTSLFQCFPISFNWSFWDGEHAGKCTNIIVQGWASMIINILADIAVLTLPLPTIWNLNLALEKRLSIIAMFSVGLFITVVSIIRVTRYATIGSDYDMKWGLDEPGFWSAIEVYVGVICACMPGMRSFCTRIFPNKKWVELTANLKRTKPSQPWSSNYTIGSKGREPSSRRQNPYFESMATEDFEDPGLWQQEYLQTIALSGGESIYGADLSITCSRS